MSARPRRMVAGLLVASMFYASLGHFAFAQEDSGTEPYHSPFLRATQSLVIPGWGQWRNGNGTAASLWFFDAALALMFASKFISFGSSENSIRFWRTAGWIAYGLDATVSAFDAYRGARRLNRENGYELDGLGSALFRNDEVPARITLFSMDF